MQSQSIIIAAVTVILIIVADVCHLHSADIQQKVPAPCGQKALCGSQVRLAGR